MRSSPKHIIDLKENEVFVFGSNESGRHGKGAAKTALKWGAVYGNPVGMQGRTYAIPTKGMDVRYSLNIEKISLYIKDFIEFASLNTDDTFLVTEIGCGLAGFKPEDIAPLFKNALNLENVLLPQTFLNIINKD